jgi:cytoskeletal protein CcmA (bactofilin family)
MFSKTGQRTDAAPPPPAEPVERHGLGARTASTGSVISAELKIVGNLNSGGDLRIDGTVEGDITSRTLTIGENARVEGSVAAETVRISGAVSGHIKATNVAIARTARVSGDITYRSLSVEEGGVLEGQCRRSEGDNVATLRTGAGSAKTASADAAHPAS